MKNKKGNRRGQNEEMGNKWKCKCIGQKSERERENGEKKASETRKGGREQIRQVVDWQSSEHHRQFYFSRQRKKKFLHGSRRLSRGGWKDEEISFDTYLLIANNFM